MAAEGWEPYPVSSTLDLGTSEGDDMRHYKTKWRIDDDGRECSKCGQYKSWDNFSNNKHGTRGKQSWCGECFRAYRGSEKQKDYHITDDGRECSRCGKFKPWGAFHCRADVSTGHMSVCKVCIKKKSQTDKKQGTIRNAELMRKYGITLKRYRKMLALQGGKCLICGSADTRVKNGGTEFSLSVDHNHETGEIRGLLCQRCNAMLGFARDDVSILRRAIQYLGGELA